MRKLFLDVVLRRRSFLLVVIFQFGLFPFLFSNLNAQTYTGSLTLGTQAEVDAFNYTTVTGVLFIGPGSITNLDGLSKLTTVGASVILQQTGITNVDGLSNLTSIGASSPSSYMLIISNNPSLTNIHGLSNLSYTGGVDIERNNSLTNLDGLSGLTHFGPITIKENNSLTNIDVLSYMTEVQELHIENNPALTNLNGLINLIDVNGDGTFTEGQLTIFGNAVTNLDALSNLKTVRHTLAIGGPDINNIDGLSNLTSAGDLQISATSITNLNAFSNITTTHFLVLESNFSLTNIDGLLNITQVHGGLFIEHESALTDLHGLSNITTIDGRLEINNNFNLQNLDGLSSLTTASSSFGITITFNDHLIDFCGLYNLFNSGGLSGPAEIHNNGANTVSISPQSQLTIFADQGLCSAVINNATIGEPTVNGCLVPITTTHTAYPAGNIFPVGTTNITWTATDAAGNTATHTRVILVVDQQPPTISCPADVTVSCASDIPVVNINSVTASDNCSAIVTHVSDDTTNKTCANRFTLTRTYRATDPAGNTATCSQTITVNDNVPPQITGLSPSQSILWPPNHTMRDVTLNYTVTDNCTTDATTTVTVSSNEPVNGTADGDTDPDWVVVDNHHIKLRAERASNGSGRIYTITVTVTDGCNAPVTATTTVEVVAHNITGPQSGKPFIVGSTVNFTGEFWDRPTNKHTAKWLIDDNTSVKGM